jgi:MscS family membrane protein
VKSSWRPAPPAQAELIFIIKIFLKTNWKWLYRLGLAALFVIACWSVWASGQETNAPAVAAVAAGKPAKVLLPVPDSSVLTFGLDRVDFLRETPVLGQPLWKYVASLLFIVLAFYIAKLLDFIVNVWLKRVVAKTKTKLDGLLLNLLHGPVKVVTFVIFLQIGLGFFEWPLRAQLFLSRGFIIVVACSVTYLAFKVLDLLLGLWREKFVSPQDKIFADMLFPLLRKVAKGLILLAAVLVTAENVSAGIMSLLAGLSVGGLALGLAAQDTMANLFGTVAIFLDKPFHLGDRIKIEGADGVVESISLRSTCIRNPDGYKVTIPNKLMGNAIITNITCRPTIRTEMNLSLAYDTPVEKVRRATAILEEIFRANPRTADLNVSFNKFGDSALNILVEHVWNGTDAKQQAAELQELNLQIKQRLEAEQIEMAFPTQTVHLKTGPGK